ncbi:unnamed protein product [Parnassius mnemosyne]|uniref:Uncharacterized protein n=1 Tax=Parnassius mnemosyne TaxID=213953 RepID=A0AAV1KT58_9NEOP
MLVIIMFAIFVISGQNYAFQLHAGLLDPAKGLILSQNNLYGLEPYRTPANVSSSDLSNSFLSPKVPGHRAHNHVGSGLPVFNYLGI